MKKLLLFVFVIMVNYINCANSFVPESYDYNIEDFFNYSLGNTYEYLYITLQGHNFEDTVFLLYGAHSIYGTLNWQGITAYLILPNMCYILYQNSLRYYLNVDSTFFDSTDYQILLKEPLELGNSWYYDSRQPHDSSNIVEIKKVNFTISVRAGTFEHCIKVGRVTYPDYLAYWIYAPDIGLIKRVSYPTFHYPDTSLYITELTDYKIQ